MSNSLIKETFFKVPKICILLWAVVFALAVIFADGAMRFWVPWCWTLAVTFTVLGEYSDSVRIGWRKTIMWIWAISTFLALVRIG